MDRRDTGQCFLGQTEVKASAGHSRCPNLLVAFWLLPALAGYGQWTPGGVAGSRVSVTLMHASGDSTAWLSSTTDSAGSTVATTGDGFASVGRSSLNFHLTIPGGAGFPELPLEASVQEKMSVYVVTGPRYGSSEELLLSIGSEDTSRLSITTERVLRSADCAYFNNIGFGGNARLLGYSEYNKPGPLTGLSLRAGHGFSIPALPVDTLTSAIPEMHLYYRVLTQKERVRIESYLAMKYGINLRGAYLNSDGDTVWSAAANRAYRHHIVAIAKDAVSALDQKQATPADEPGFMTVAVDTLTQWNRQNPAQLPEKHFLICGDNGEERKWAPREPGKAQMLKRRWLMQRTGTSLLNGVVQLNTRMINNAPEHAETYWLVIDRTGSGGFGLGSTDYYESTRVLSDSLVQFTDVVWDVDGSGTDVFTFAVGGSFVPTTWITAPVCDPEQAGQVNAGIVGGEPTYAFELNGTTNGFHHAWTSNTGAVEAVTDVPSGEYHLRISDATGYAIDDELWIQATDAPVIPLNDSYTLHAETRLELEAHVDGPGTYEWRSEDRVIGTQSRLLVERTGSYRCTVSVDGCVARKDISVTSTSEDGAFEMAILPNPAENGDFVVQVSMSEPADARLLIADNMGRPVIDRTLRGQSFYRVPEHLDTPGVYLVTVQVDGILRTGKLVVM